MNPQQLLAQRISATDQLSVWVSTFAASLRRCGSSTTCLVLFFPSKHFDEEAKPQQPARAARTSVFFPVVICNPGGSGSSFSSSSEPNRTFAQRRFGKLQLKFSVDPQPSLNNTTNSSSWCSRLSQDQTERVDSCIAEWSRGIYGTTASAPCEGVSFGMFGESGRGRHEVQAILYVGNSSNIEVEGPLSQNRELFLLLRCMRLEAALYGRGRDKESEQADVMSRELFLANMTHEIKTPLNGIVGYTQLLLRTSLNAAQRAHVKDMSLCSLQLMKIVNDVLDFSKLVSNNMPLKKDCFSVEHLFSDLRRTILQDMRAKKQYLVCTFAEGSFPDYAVADKQKILQILVNLVNNASKFSSFEACIKVVVSVPERHVFRFVVMDEGIGISPDQINKLFDPFVQIENSRTKQGSGLGLAICRKLVELLGGKIEVESDPDRGSKFCFTVGFADPDNGRDISIDGAQAADGEVSDLLRARKVLLVDDNHDNRIQIADLLYSWGMEVVVCATAIEALRTLMSRRHSFDLALVDICMPDVSGTQLAEQIKQEMPLFPLIALSSLDDIKEDNFEFVLYRPFHDVQLFKAVHATIYRKSHEQAYIGKDSARSRSRQRETAEDERRQHGRKRTNFGARILVAEDVLYNRTVLVEMLRTLGYSNVESAEDGRQALEMLYAAGREDAGEDTEQESAFDVLLVDLRMPVADGFWLLENLYGDEGEKRINALCSDLRIAAVTASELAQDKNRCAEFGVQYFVSKPIDMDTLNKVMFELTSLPPSPPR